MSNLIVTLDGASVSLPGLDCGVCGFRRCSDLAAKAASQPEIIKRCIHLSDARYLAADLSQDAGGQNACVTCGPRAACAPTAGSRGIQQEWQDTLGRDFDFYLEHFPEDPGPREIILPHNPLITRELEVQEGDTLIGRPLGMSCGCPITHCGVAMNVDRRTGVIVWCVTGPLNPRKNGFKDLGYYIAEGYEGLIRRTRVDVCIGMRYYFQPHMCMLQWRHSGLVNYLNRTDDALQVRLEGLWIG
jgi:uncharacterized Fe-S cluster-containing protein